jgi:hypothetical protein
MGEAGAGEFSNPLIQVVAIPGAQTRDDHYAFARETSLTAAKANVTGGQGEAQVRRERAHQHSAYGRGVCPVVLDDYPRAPVPGL